MRWEDAKKYFLVYLPEKDKKKHSGKDTLSKNKKYERIKAALKENKFNYLIEIKFLIGISPIFLRYLTIMQSEGPLVHYMFSEMKLIISTLMRRFMAVDVVDKCTTGKELAELDIKDETNHLPLEKCDFGSEVTQALKNASKERREQSSQKLKAALVTIVVYFQKNLPFTSKLLISLQYLEDIPEEWYLEENGNPKRLDVFWNKIFHIRSDSGAQKCTFLKKLIKFFVSPEWKRCM